MISMIEKRDAISVEEAVHRVMQYAHVGGTEKVAIHEAYGRFLGEDLIATYDIPFFDRSAFDGYAVRSQDLETASRENPVTLEVVGAIGAGSIHEAEVKAGQTVRIMTGAPIPKGCDAVVMLELVVEQENKIVVKRSIKKGENISFTGEDTKKGTILAAKGTRINPGITALLATFGYAEVTVAKKPTVGVMATGSELLRIEEPLEPGKIRNSNGYMILSQIERAGGKPVNLGQFTDDLEVCYENMKEAISKVDFLITTGGVSVGDFDLLPELYERLGAKVLFNKVRMRPGSVTTIAEKDGKLLFGLSGNPSACYVGFELFARPVIQTFLHSSNPFVRKVKAFLGIDFPKPNPFDRFVRGHLTYSEGKLVAKPSGLDKSNVVSSLAAANALIRLPGGTRGFQKGMEVEVLLLEDQEGTGKW